MREDARSSPASRFVGRRFQVHLGRLVSHERGQEHHENALTIFRELGQRRNEGIVLGNLGNLQAALGRDEQARGLQDAALAIHREGGNRRDEGVALGNLGDLLLKRGQWKEAEGCLREAIAIGDEVWVVLAGTFRGSLAVLLGNRGEFATAHRLLDQGEELLRAVHPKEHGQLLCRRGAVERLAGDLDAACESLRQAQQIADSSRAGELSELGEAIASLGNALAG